MEPAPENQDWLDQVQTGRVSPEEAAQLQTRLNRFPREAARLQAELALNAALDTLPDAPVPSNFASRVMAGIERDEAPALRGSAPFRRWWAGLHLFRPAAITAVVALALSGWWQFRLRERHSLAASVSAVSRAAAVPGVEVLRDFDAIQLLRTPAQPGDVELIAVLATP